MFEKCYILDVCASLGYASGLTPFISLSFLYTPWKIYLQLFEIQQRGMAVAAIAINAVVTIKNRKSNLDYVKTFMKR